MRTVHGRTSFGKALAHRTRENAHCLSRASGERGRFHLQRPQVTPTVKHKPTRQNQRISQNQAVKTYPTNDSARWAIQSQISQGHVVQQETQRERYALPAQTPKAPGTHGVLPSYYQSFLD